MSSAVADAFRLGQLQVLPAVADGRLVASIGAVDFAVAEHLLRHALAVPAAELGLGAF